MMHFDVEAIEQDKTSATDSQVQAADCALQILVKVVVLQEHGPYLQVVGRQAAQ